MTLTLRLLGVELLHFEISTEPPEDDDTERDLSGGNTTSEAIGFTASPGIQRWEQGADL